MPSWAHRPGDAASWLIHAGIQAQAELFTRVTATDDTAPTPASGSYRTWRRSG